MKLKLYRYTLIFMLLISFIITLILGIKSTINVIKFDKAQLMDGIIYLLCYFLLLVFTLSEVFNTIVSFKNGSTYIVQIAYKDNKTLNRNSMMIVGGLSIFSLFAIIYISLVINGYNYPLYKLDIEAQYFILAAFVSLLINMVYILLFPIFAAEDQSLKDNK